MRNGARIKTCPLPPLPPDEGSRLRPLLNYYIGEKEQAHLLSYFGNDAEVAAVTAAIQENHRFDLRFPDGVKAAHWLRSRCLLLQGKPEPSAPAGRSRGLRAPT